MDAVLELRKVGEIKGSFFIPSYQRGYRWGENEVWRLLDDIYQNKNANYCLQPIVLRRDGETYRVVDGQQRLTTIYLICKYMHEDSKGYIEAPAFDISYETRPDSRDFLMSNIDEMECNMDKNIDYWFMTNAYKTVDEWFSDESKGKKSILTSDINKLLNESVNVIWYEIGPEEDERKLFTRLNIGKIPLTSAELTKAMFLSRTSSRQISREKQEEIALQWDNIERELNGKSLWYFLTNASNRKYQTHIDLVLDLVAEKKPSDEPYYTFFYFDKSPESKNLEEIWQNIYHTFLIFKDWHEDHGFYHKVGYLISTGLESLDSIYKISNGQTKTAFSKMLDQKIRNTILSERDIEDLSYENSKDYELIQRLLLLFNVESVRSNGKQTQWFPFDQYKEQNWSLEHIHARKSDLSRRKDVWLEWLSMHLDSLKNTIPPDSRNKDDFELISEIQKYLDLGEIEFNQFDMLQNRIIDKLSADSDEEYIHTTSNMALLKTDDNSALNNSAFDVKRNKIIEMDQSGKFIPFCTKMVFLKYYSPSNETQVHFWSDKDRRHYMEHIKRTLAKYLNESEVQDVK